VRVPKAIYTDGEEPAGSAKDEPIFWLPERIRFSRTAWPFRQTHYNPSKRRLFTNQYDVTSNGTLIFNTGDVFPFLWLLIKSNKESVTFASQLPRIKLCTCYMKTHITWNAFTQNNECLDDRNSTVTDSVLGHVRGINTVLIFSNRKLGNRIMKWQEEGVRIWCLEWAVWNVRNHCM